MKPCPAAEQLLRDTIGLDPEAMGRKTIRLELDSFMRTLGQDDPNAYVDLLMSSKEVLDQFIERIVVKETWFFRDRDAFRFLRHYVKEKTRDRRRGTMRVLSIPCSTGEEPYSIAMTFLDEGLAADEFYIDAVDISAKALQAAERAIYGKSSFRGAVKHYEERYFRPLQDRFQLDPGIVRLVHFHHDNFLKGDFRPPRGSYEIVFCKNLLIYLEPGARQKLFRYLDDLLVPGGILFTGHSELSSFLQYGFRPAPHARSFACLKPEERRGQGEDQRPIPTDPVKRRPRESLWRGKRQEERAIPRELIKEEGGAIPGEKRKEPEPSLSHIRDLADKGFLHDASRLCEQYLMENGTNKDGHCLMGLISQALNRFDRAESHFLKALYLDPLYYEALVHMALLCDQRGESERAALFRERLKRLDEPDGREGKAV